MGGGDASFCCLAYQKKLYQINYVKLSSLPWYYLQHALQLPANKSFIDKLCGRVFTLNRLTLISSLISCSWCCNIKLFSCYRCTSGTTELLHCKLLNTSKKNCENVESRKKLLKEVQEMNFQRKERKMSNNFNLLRSRRLTMGSEFILQLFTKQKSFVLNAMQPREL